MAWQPLSSRIAGNSEPPHEGVPGHLKAPLWAWLKQFLVFRGEFRRTLIVRLASMSRAVLRTDADQIDAYYDFHKACTANDAIFLNALDAMLHLLENETSDRERAIEALRQELSIGGSAWTVSPDGLCLTQQVDPTAQAAAEEAVRPADGASIELAEAWRKAYGRNPDGSDAWDHAIKAVEFALQPIVSPLNSGATFGTIIRDLDNGKHKFGFTLANNDGSEIESVLGILNLMWVNPDRHGGPSAKMVTIEESRVIVHLAVAVVQIARDAALWKNP